MKTFTRMTSIALMLLTLSSLSMAQDPALKFNNTDNVINLDQTLIENNLNYTIEMWLKAEDGGNGNGDQIYCEGSATSNGSMIRIYSAGGKLNFRSYNGADGVDARFASGDIFTSPATWHHVAIVGETPGGIGTETNVEMFVDGISAGTGTYKKPTTSFTKITIGDLSRTSNQGGIYAYNGEIDELRLWSKALTAAEIASNSCIIADNTGLEAHFKFNEATGSTTYEEVSGTSATIEGTTPTWTTNGNCTATSIENEEAEGSISIYPNPTNSILYISSKDNNNTIDEVNIYNTAGSCVYTQKGGDNINVENLAKGMYFVNISVDGQNIAKKLIIN